MSEETRLKTEQSVLGAMLIDEKAIGAFINHGGSSAWFNDQACREAYNKTMHLFESGRVADSMTVEAEGVDGLFIDNCIDLVPSAAYIEAYASTLEHYHVKDRLCSLVDVIGKRLQTATPTTIDSIKSSLEQGLDGIEFGAPEEEVNLSEKGHEWIDECMDEKTARIGWGVEKVTGVMGRLSNEYIWLMAQPSIGKTAYALQMMERAANDGITTSMASLESSAKSIVSRLICLIGGINTWRIRQGIATKAEVDCARRASDQISKLIRVVDTNMTIDQICAWGHAEKRKGSQMLIIDNTRSIGGFSTADRVNEMANVSSRLNILRKELDMPVVVLHHTTVNADGTEKASWGADAGRDADIMVILSRDEVESEALQADGEPLSDAVNLVVVKNRDGDRPPPIALEFMKGKQRFK